MKGLTLLISASLLGCAAQRELPALRQNESMSERAGIVIVQRESEYSGAGSQALQVENTFGELDVRAHPEGQVLWRAVVQKLQPDADAQISASLERGVFKLQVGCVRTQPKPCDRKALRVDLAVAQPAGHALTARTSDDRLRVKGLDGVLTLHSGQGQILADSASHMNAETAGDIAATLRAPQGRDSELRSTGGKITLALPTSGNYQLQVSAPSIYHGLDVPGQRIPASGQLQRTYGKAAVRVRITAPRGEVELIGLVPAPAY